MFKKQHIRTNSENNIAKMPKSRVLKKINDMEIKITTDYNQWTSFSKTIDNENIQNYYISNRIPIKKDLKITDSQYLVSKQFSPKKSRNVNSTLSISVKKPILHLTSSPSSFEKKQNKNNTLRDLLLPFGKLGPGPKQLELPMIKKQFPISKQIPIKSDIKLVHQTNFEKNQQCKNHKYEINFGKEERFMKLLTQIQKRQRKGGQVFF